MDRQAWSIVMIEREFEDYIALLRGLLRLRKTQCDAIADELRDHMDARLEDLLAEGIPREKAVKIALEEFGDAAGVGQAFLELNRNNQRRWNMKITAASLVTCTALGLAAMAFWPEGAPEVANRAMAQEEGGAGVAGVPQAPGGSPSVERTKEENNALTAQKLSRLREVFQIEQQQIQEVAAFIGELCDVNVIVDRQKLEESGIETGSALELTLRNVRIDTALELLLKEINAGYYIHDGIVIITSQEALAAVTEVRVYNVADLVYLDTHWPLDPRHGGPGGMMGYPMPGGSPGTGMGPGGMGAPGMPGGMMPPGGGSPYGGGAAPGASGSGYGGGYGAGTSDGSSAGGGSTGGPGGPGSIGGIGGTGGVGGAGGVGGPGGIGGIGGAGGKAGSGGPPGAGFGAPPGGAGGGLPGAPGKGGPGGGGRPGGGPGFPGGPGGSGSSLEDAEGTSGGGDATSGASSAGASSSFSHSELTISEGSTFLAQMGGTGGMSGSSGEGGGSMTGGGGMGGIGGIQMPPKYFSKDPSKYEPHERRAIDLIHAIKSSVEPESWGDEGMGGEGAIRPFEGLLIIRNTPKAHHGVEILLQQIRAARHLHGGTGMGGSGMRGVGSMRGISVNIPAMGEGLPSNGSTFEMKVGHAR
jgi:hypothetical protein